MDRNTVAPQLVFLATNTMPGAIKRYNKKS